MAILTKTEKLDLFCEKHGYVFRALPDETKQQFVTRTAKEWMNNEVKDWLRHKRTLTNEQQLESDLSGEQL